MKQVSLKNRLPDYCVYFRYARRYPFTSVGVECSFRLTEIYHSIIDASSRSKISKNSHRSINQFRDYVNHNLI